MAPITVLILNYAVDLFDIWHDLIQVRDDGVRRDLNWYERLYVAQTDLDITFIVDLPETTLIGDISAIG